ncbi:transmembrane protein 198 [Stomoxys calcitrans]|uniref:Transmembrane protein 198 n=1 Tax=Stomoxys calcitrans TaxID=35570 RepID=A0A1I8NZX9_STOCA|nr:transmembrane protein 198 [Stomoxys calcitrans]
MTMDSVFVYEHPEYPEIHKMDWQFFIKGFLDDHPCTSAPPDTMYALLWSMCAVFGIVFVLLGYRCLRAVGFLTGAFIGIKAVAMMRIYITGYLGEPADAASSLVGGLVGAVLGSTYPVATFFISAFAGVILAGAAMAVCVATMPDNEFGQIEIAVALIGGAIICSVLTLCSAKYVTILTTSVVGSAMIICSVDFFLHGLQLTTWIFNMKPHPNPPACYGGILIFAWPVSIIIGLMIQSFITAWGIDHRKRVFQKRHQQLARMQSRPRETREEARQRKFRYLYQVRTARGDIISQNFVSALQKRIQLSGTETPSERSLKTSSNERNTFRSDRTHFTTIPPDSDMFDKIEIVRDIA